MKRLEKSSPSRANEILSRPYTRRLTPDEAGGYVGTILEFPGCFAEGASPDEALHNLDKVAASWIEVALLNEYEFRDPVSFEGCSGKIALRIPRGLHKQVAELAELEDSSVNQLLSTAISAYVSERNAYHEFRRAMIEMRDELRESIGLFRFHRTGPSSITIESSLAKQHYHRGITVAPPESAVLKRVQL